MPRGKAKTADQIQREAEQKIAQVELKTTFKAFVDGPSEVTLNSLSSSVEKYAALFVQTGTEVASNE